MNRRNFLPALAALPATALAAPVRKSLVDNGTVVRKRRVVLDRETMLRCQFHGCTFDASADGGAFIHCFFNGDRHHIDERFGTQWTRGTSQRETTTGKDALTEMRFEDCCIVTRATVYLDCEFVHTNLFDPAECLTRADL